MKLSIKFLSLVLLASLLMPIYGVSASSRTSINQVRPSQTEAAERYEILAQTSGEEIAQEPLDDNDETPGCSAGSAINFAAKFIICPLVELLIFGIDFAYDVFVNNLLEVTPLNREGSEADQVLFTIWSNFRAIANILFIGVLLFAILGQSMSWFLTPYELKKILPRLFIGIIAVQISWYLVGYLVDIFNIIGAGVRALMLAPLDGVSGNIELNVGEGIGGFLNDMLLNLLATVGAAAFFFSGGGGIMGLVMILFPAFMALLGAMVTLLARRVLISILIIGSPIALVAWILPNTSNITKTWWSLLTKALFMYPIIIMLISSGELLARIMSAENGNDGVNSIARSMSTIVAVFAPYFAIPLTFRFAGGAIAALSGNATRMGQGLKNNLFGDANDPNSLAGRQQLAKNTRRVNRRGSALRRRDSRSARNQAVQDGAAGSGSKSASANYARWRSSKVREGGSKAFDRLTDMAFSDNHIEEAQVKQAAAERIATQIGNGSDGEIGALASTDGKTNPWTGNDLSEAEIAFAENIQRMTGGDRFLSEEALRHAAKKLNDPEQLDALRESWVTNYSNPDNSLTGKAKRRLGLDSDKFNQFERNTMWDNVVSHPEVQAIHVDQKYRNRETGQIDDSGKQLRFLEDVNQLYGMGALQGQRASTYDGIASVAEDVKSQVDAGTMSRDDPKVQQLREMRKTLGNTSFVTGSASAQTAKENLTLGDGSGNGILNDDLFTV